MSFSAYAKVWRTPGVARLVIVSVFARLPTGMSGLIITLHVVTTLFPDNYTRASIATAAHIVGIALGAPWRGRVVDRKGLRRAVAPSLVATLACWCAAPFLSFIPFLIACFVMGVFTIPVFPVIRVALAAMVKPADLAAAFALDAVITELTFVIAPVIGTQLVVFLGSPTALIAIGVSSVLAGGLLFWFNPPTRSGKSSTAAHDAEKSAGRLLTAPVIAILACSVALTFTLMGAELGIVASMREWDLAELAGWVLAVWALGSAVGGLLYGALPRQMPLMALLVLLVATTALCALPTSAWWLAVAVFASGLFCAPAFTTLNHALVTSVPEERRGEINGWNGTMLQLGSAAAAPIVGMAIDRFGPPASYLAAAALGLIVTALAAVLRGRLRKSTAPATVEPT